MGSNEKKGEYSIEFKIDAARLVVEQGYTVKDACERLGVPLSNMTRWLNQYRKGKLQPGPKQAQPTGNETEVKRLQSEVKRLEMEVAILKKAATYKSLQPEVTSMNHYDHDNGMIRPAKGFFLRGRFREVLLYHPASS